jgi:hypothetical protein
MARICYLVTYLQKCLHKVCSFCIPAPGVVPADITGAIRSREWPFILLGIGGWLVGCLDESIPIEHELSLRCVGGVCFFSVYRVS